jgi:Lipocalin-like domain
MIKKLFILIIFPLIFFLLLPAQIPSPNPIHGVWKVVEIRQEVSGKEYNNTEPQPGLMIFTQDYYSMVWMPLNRVQPDNATTWHPIDAEKIQQFNSIVVNSGSYSLSDSRLTTFPIVAKTPEFIGGKAEYLWKSAQDTLRLELVNIYSRDGVLDEESLKFRTTLFLVRIE